ncbi:craniofacial development protein 1 [Synchiropus picturatus]
MMNYSDYDSDGYSSNEDADYVPSDDNLSEDDLNDCEKEEPLNEDDEVPHPGNPSKKKSKKKDISARKRKKGILVVDKEEKKEGGDAMEVKPPQEEGEKTTAQREDDDEERQKKKSDDLWASFLSDVGTRPKPSSDASQPTNTQKQRGASPSPSTPVKSTKTQAETEKVVITKVFDFAGEQVKVEKEVAADSREAKSFLKSQSTNQEEKVTPPTPSGPSVKRPAGMSSILCQIGGKKPKMSTLEKSKMDWDAFKSEEGISEELAIHNRGREGYVERKNFLERVDHRQFELEKSVRLSNMKR